MFFFFQLDIFLIYENTWHWSFIIYLRIIFIQIVIQTTKAASVAQLDAPSD